MLLTKVVVKNFKAIDDSGEVKIDPGVTVLVGQNESGKTAFLQALEKCRSVREGKEFRITEDFPRKSLVEYQRRHETKPADAAHLTYELSKSEIDEVNKSLGGDVFTSLTFTLNYNYKNTFTIGIDIPEKPYIDHLLAKNGITGDLANKLQHCTSIKELIETLSKIDLNTEGEKFLASMRERFKLDTAPEWQNRLALEIWSRHIQARVPKFFYFDDYYLLPGKVNLAELKRRMVHRDHLEEGDRTMLSLLRMAGVNTDELANEASYEQIKAQLEGLSNTITDKIFKYWRQNQELDVEFDIRPDPADSPPFNNGANLYVRIRDRRHRVTVPFTQRSKGFIWFFSFIVWFDTIQEQERKGSPLILLFDEPGLSLHALAQRDFLSYIDTLAQSHQILYTTHSPFMIHSDRLHQVRLVEDRRERGTVVSDHLSASNSRTIYPLQAALGYTLAQKLFVSKRNLLVEGPSELVYLRFFSSALESAKKTSLRGDIAIVPAGGLDQVATFAALLGAGDVELAILQNSKENSDQGLESLVKDKLIRDRQILNYGFFREGPPRAKAASKSTTPPTAGDIEDLIGVSFYLKLFNAAFKKPLGGNEIKEADLPDGDRIVDRIDRYLESAGIAIRPAGGFNRYAVASYLAGNPPKTIDKETLGRFTAVIDAINKLFRSAD